MSTVSENFAGFGLAESLLRALEDVGYEAPSPIQAACLPPLLAGEDVLGQAQTGTGKTAAFALPLLQRLDLSLATPQALILTPTRELALQVAEAIRTYSKHMPGVEVLAVYGGQGMGTQLQALRRRVHIVVGTPGRVMDHVSRGTLDLAGLRLLVLDEADEMLRMGFIDDVEWLLEHMPAERQMALFSATLPDAIRAIARRHLHAPREIRIASATTTVASIRQRYWQVRDMHKQEVLTRLLEVEDVDAALVFVRTKIATAEVADALVARGFLAAALHGDMNQHERERTVAQLKSGRLNVVVATDVAARGLDVARISHVINYDVPLDAEAYVHRIGRTGRAGRAGEAILFVFAREVRLLRHIERSTGQHVEPMAPPSLAQIAAKRQQRFATRIRESLEAAAASPKESARLDYIRAQLLSLCTDDGIEPMQLAALLANMVEGDSPTFVTPAEIEAVEPTYRPRVQRDAPWGDRGPRRTRDDYEQPPRYEPPAPKPAGKATVTGSSMPVAAAPAPKAPPTRAPAASNFAAFDDDVDERDAHDDGVEAEDPPMLPLRPRKAASAAVVVPQVPSTDAASEDAVGEAVAAEALAAEETAAQETAVEDAAVEDVAVEDTAVAARVATDDAEPAHTVEDRAAAVAGDDDTGLADDAAQDDPEAVAAVTEEASALLAMLTTRDAPSVPAAAAREAPLADEAAPLADAAADADAPAGDTSLVPPMPAPRAVRETPAPAVRPVRSERPPFEDRLARERPGTDRPPFERPADRHADRPAERMASDRAPRERPPRRGGDDVPMARYRIEVGREHQVEVRQIVGAIANEGGIDGRYIGRIDMSAYHSTLDLPADLPRDLLRHLAKVRVGKHILRLAPAEAGDELPRPDETAPARVRRRFADEGIDRRAEARMERRPRADGPPPRGPATGQGGQGYGGPGFAAGNGGERPARPFAGPPRARSFDGPPRERSFDGPPRERSFGGPPRERSFDGPPRERGSYGPPRERGDAPPRAGGYASRPDEPARPRGPYPQRPGTPDRGGAGRGDGTRPMFRDRAGPPRGDTPFRADTPRSRPDVDTRRAGPPGTAPPVGAARYERDVRPERRRSEWRPELFEQGAAAPRAPADGPADAAAARPFRPRPSPAVAGAAPSRGQGSSYKGKSNALKARKANDRRKGRD